MDLFAGSSLQPSSVSLFTTKLKEWVSWLPPHTQAITTILLFPSVSQPVLLANMRTKSASNRHIYYMAVLSVFRHCATLLTSFPPQLVQESREEWTRMFRENEAPIIERRRENKPTERQMAKGGSILTYEHLTSLRDELEPGSMDRLLMCMYTMIPPVRADYYAMEIVYEDATATSPNYMRLKRDLTEGECVLTNFKTSKTYGEIRNVLPSELLKEIGLSLEKQPRKYVFQNHNGQSFTRNGYSIWSRRQLSRVCSTEFTLVFFRHAYVTHYLSNRNELTDGAVKEMSDRMGHSPEMFRAYRWVGARSAPLNHEELAGGLLEEDESGDELLDED